MSSVLITGASGFIGRHTLQKLNEEFDKVHAVYRSQKPDVNLNNLVWHKIDLFDTEKVKKLLTLTRPSHLLHLAWYLEPGKYGNSPLNMNWVIASLQLVRLFSELGGQRVVCAGTCFEYELENGFLSEARTSRKPDQFYGICKKNLSDTLLRYSDINELSLAWGHVFYVYGPHEYPERLVASVIRSLISNKTAKCSSGEQLKDYLHVNDVADAFVSILKSNVKGRINIGSGNAISIKNLVLKIGEIMNKKHLIDLGALPDREDEPPLILADIRRLKNKVGWAPKFNHNDGLTNTIDWWKMEKDHEVT